MKQIYYRQCKLQKGNTHRRSWIPEQFAKINSIIKLKDADDNWDNGWQVTEVGQYRLEEKKLPDFHNDRKVHRKATGDSVPKERKEK